MICTHCRLEFTQEEAEQGCKACGLFGGCHLIKCPHCGYEQAAEPEMLRWLRRKFHKGHKAGHHHHGHHDNHDHYVNTTPDTGVILSLSTLAVGDTGYVHSLLIDDQTLLRKLMALGLLPGVRIKLIQKYPAFVLQMGYTQIAIDRQLAGVIKITPDLE